MSPTPASSEGPELSEPTAEGLGLSFTERHRHRPFALVAPGFVVDSRSPAGRVAGPTRSEASPPAPFAAVEMDVRSAGGTLVAGLSSGDGDRVVATYTPARRTAALQVRAGGRTWVVRRAKVALPEAFTLGFAVCENQVTVLARTPAEGWRALVTCRDRVAARIDLRRPETLRRFTYTWGTDSGTAELGDVRAGLFGMTGLRDPHLVQHADGRAFVRDGKVYLTWTCAGLGSFAQAHWGVFTLDLERPNRLDQVAQLYTSRDGLLLGDHAGQLVRDGNRWLVATSSWGDFDERARGPLRDGVHVRHLTTTEDLLDGVHLLTTERTPLPTDVGSWDPGFTRVDGRWVLGFVESPSQRPFDFHPALASTPDDDPWTGLTRVGAATELHRCEGPVLACVDGRWWLLASDERARQYPVFDLQMRRVGSLDAPYLTNIPHPQLLRRDDGSWLMVTFDGAPYGGRLLGYGGHGDVVVLAGDG
ncbi:MAG TPA: hypothetical protein VER39_12290 [Nocardioidaceae bacterium]|nr:hypothetical protein [Nocardioidaceae bacterium]